MANMEKNIPAEAAAYLPENTAKDSGAIGAVASADTWLQGKETRVFMVLFALMAGIIFKDFLLLKQVYLFKDIGNDTLTAFLPVFKDTSRYLREVGIPTWSFKQGLGQNILPNALNDPFKALLYLPNPANLSYWIVWVEVLKLFVGGYFFCRFLTMLGIGSLNALVGALLYAFSGYAMVGSGWFVFTASMVQLSLMLWGVEVYLQTRSWWLFVVAIALVAASFVYLYIFSLFLGMYLLIHFFREEAMSGRQFAVLLAQIAGLGVLGCLIGAAFGLPVFIEVLESPRVAGESGHAGRLSRHAVFGIGDSLYRMTLVMRSFGNDLLGTGYDFKGWQNYLEAPMNYGGVLSLLLAPQIFAYCKGKERIGFAIVLGFFSLTLIFPWFRYAFWLFSGDYFRLLSLCVSTVFILYSCITLAKITANNRLHWPLLGGTAISLLVLLYLPYAGAESIDTAQQGMAAFLVVLYTGLVALIANPRTRAIGQFSLLGIICVELVVFSFPVPNKRDVVTVAELSRKVGYNDYTVDALKIIRAQDKGFYRVYKNFHSSPDINSSLNDAKVQGYYASASYYSFNQPNYIRFLAGMGIIDPKDENQTRWAPGVEGAPILQALTAHKYTFYRGVVAEDPLLAATHEEMGKAGDVTILKNKNHIPLGTGYGYCMARSEHQKLDKIRRGIAALRAIILPDSAMASRPWLTPIVADSIPVPEKYTVDLLAADAGTRKASGLEPATPHGQAHLVFESNFARQQTILFSIPFDKGWSAAVDGQPKQLLVVDYGLIGLDMAPGKHRIVLQYNSPMMPLAITLSAIGCALFAMLLLLGFLRKRKEKSLSAM